jgi:hypothetical protein
MVDISLVQYIFVETLHLPVAGEKPAVHGQVPEVEASCPAK